jgi:hypothetical protein
MALIVFYSLCRGHFALLYLELRRNLSSLYMNMTVHLLKVDKKTI